MMAREIVYRLYIAMESRLLSPDERALQARLKQSYLGLASLERTMVRQRTKIRGLSEGDATTSFFLQHASYHRQKNVIRSLHVDGAVVVDHAPMAEATYHHFHNLLGQAACRQFSLDIYFLGASLEDLSDLDAPFSKEEVWDVVRRLRHGKAPGPNGFMAEFLWSCWGMVKADFMAAFDKLYSMNGLSFQGLNQALVTLLPKNGDVSALGDYRPISLIHIFAKLMAKLLASRLAPRLGSLVDVNFASVVSTITSCWFSRRHACCIGLKNLESCLSLNRQGI